MNIRAIPPRPGPVRVWTIYRHPSDYPEDYVARLWESDSAGTRPTGSIVVSPKLEIVRDHMRELGLTRLERDPGDDPAILETWI